MSENSSICQYPEHLKRNPKECTPEQIEQCHGTKRDHPCLNEKVSISDMKKNPGSVPGPVILMSKRDGFLDSFMGGYNNLLSRGPLSERERFLIALSASTAMKTGPCIESHSKKAVKAGATEDEVLQTILIACMISNTTSLHVAYDAASLFHPSSEE